MTVNELNRQTVGETDSQRDKQTDKRVITVLKAELSVSNPC